MVQKLKKTHFKLYWKVHVKKGDGKSNVTSANHEP